ncbi:hypothetical protein GEMRC1_004320 [Eukaryota sp. GEM-RC1]
MYSLTELIYANDILTSLDPSASAEAIKVRIVHSVIFKSGLDLSNVFVYDTLYSLFSVKRGYVPFKGLVLLLRGIASFQSDPSSVMQMTQVMPALIPHVHVTPFKTHKVPSADEAYPTLNCF